LFRANTSIRVDRCETCNSVEAESFITLELIETVLEREAATRRAYAAGQEIAKDVRRQHVMAEVAHPSGFASVLPVPEVSPGPVTIVLLALFCIGFVMPAVLPSVRSLAPHLALQPVEIRHGSDLYQLLTSAFLHGGWLHLIGNGYFLFVFGAAVEVRVGSRAFVGLYTLFAVASALGYAAIETHPALGASGAISGLMGMYLVVCRNNVANLVRVVFWAGQQTVIYYLLREMQLRSASPVAWEAHLSGLATGLVAGIAWLRWGRRRAAPRAADV
jgi:membrane associated rhomboid family serine protease